MPGHFLELFFFIFPDVAQRAFGKPIHEKRYFPLPEKNNAAEPLRLALPRTGNPLFDDPAPQVRIDLTLIRTRDGLSQDIGGDFLFSCKSPKPCVLEYFQVDRSGFSWFSLYHT